MSVRVISWVWENSQSEGIDRLVLLAIADCANDEGGNAYPSMSTLIKKTRVAERTVQRAVKALTDSGELSVARNAGPRGVNVFTVMMTAPVIVTPRQPDTRHSDTEGVSESRDNPRHADTQTVKEQPSLNRQKNLSSERPEIAALCERLADRIEANGSNRPTVTQRWLDAARLMLDRDGREVEKVEKAIDWCQADTFWRANILSMPKLREKYDQLRLAAQRSAPHLSTVGRASDKARGWLTVDQSQTPALEGRPA